MEDVVKTILYEVTILIPDINNKYYFIEKGLRGVSINGHPNLLFH